MPRRPDLPNGLALATVLTAAAACAAATPAPPAQVPPPASSRPTSAPAPPAASGGCRSGDPMTGVYHPYRLQVRQHCLSVTGTVAYIRHEDDGDVHVDLALPAAESHLLDQANYAHEDGELVTEIVPADQPGCVRSQPPPLPATAYRSSGYDYGVCTGAAIATPSLGAEVTVTGPYVLDSDHGWMEIHPGWSIDVTGSASTPPSTATAPAADTEPHPGKDGPSCQVTAAPSHDGYPGDYEVFVHSNLPRQRATASDAADTWSTTTDAEGYADIRLYHTSPGMAVTVTVGAATCRATA